MRRLLLVLVLALLPSLALAETPAEHRAALLRGVDALDRPGVPGNLVVFGDDAFAVITGGQRAEPVVAAATYGRGRVVVMAHSGYLDATALPKQDDSRGTLLRNALAWATRGAADARIGVLGRDAPLVAAMSKHAVVIDAIDVARLGTVDVLVWKNGAGDAQTAEAVAAFVENGGSLVTAACPWGWAQLRQRQGLSVRDDMPENAALRRMGIVYADGTTDATQDGRYVRDDDAADAAHAGRALAALVAGEKNAEKRAYLVERALRALPVTDDAFLPHIEAAIDAVPDTGVPRPGKPLGKRDPLARLAVTVRSVRWRDLPQEEVGAFPGADAFPGAIPDGAPVVSRGFHADPGVSGWQSTGLYARPGARLTVHVSTRRGGRTTDEVDRNPEPTGWRIRIGCHKDKLWHKDRWERWPEITYQLPIPENGLTTVSPWGGPVYLEATAGARETIFKIGGVAEAPHFVLGDADSEASWKTRRLAPAPWAEIEGRHMVLSVPSEVVRELDDVKRVAEFWDAVLTSHCKLAGTPLPERRERFVPDVQISAGYMHSGYPIMMHLDTVTVPEDGGLAPLVDVDARSSTNSWGYFHELGHNRQRGWWTFRGTTEVTCNLFSLYTGEAMSGLEPWKNPWLQAQKKKAKPYLAAGANFQQWRRQPGLALLVYAQIQREFGWEPFTKVFRDYEEGPATERPTADQAKIDQFVVRLSKATGRDLRKLWSTWGAPLSDWVKTDRELGALPEWMPDMNDFE